MDDFTKLLGEDFSSTKIQAGPLLQGKVKGGLP
jgi:hypothetical protein